MERMPRERASLGLAARNRRVALLASCVLELIATAAIVERAS